MDNIDKNTMDNIKNMVDSGKLSDAISQISPEMIQNFSKMLSEQNNGKSSSSENVNINQDNSNQNSEQNSEQSSENPGFNLNNLDMNTIMKLSSAFGNMNNKNDPRANLLNSLKPYLRNGKQSKLDNYINLLNVTKLADVMKNNNKENNNG